VDHGVPATTPDPGEEKAFDATHLAFSAVGEPGKTTASGSSFFLETRPVVEGKVSEDWGMARSGVRISCSKEWIIICVHGCIAKGVWIVGSSKTDADSSTGPALLTSQLFPGSPVNRLVR
jgi:hypothetical protein